MHKRCGRRGARHGTGVQPYKVQVHRGASKRLEPGEGLRVQRHQLTGHALALNLLLLVACVIELTVEP